MRNLFCLIFLLCFCAIKAQTLSQTLRGTVVDKVSQSPIPGAIVQLLNSDPANATMTNEKGIFKLIQVPIGKQTIKNNP